MRILVDNSGYGLGNIGDVAMLQVAYHRLREEFNDAEILIFTSNPVRLQKYCPGALPVPERIFYKGRSIWLGQWSIFGGLHRILPKSMLPRLRLWELILQAKCPRFSKNWISWRFRKNKEVINGLTDFYDLILTSDIVMATGGGFVNDVFEKHAHVVLGTLSLAQTLKIPTYMFGQGIGPIASPLLSRFAKKVLPLLNQLTLREVKSNNFFLDSLSLNKHKTLLTGDDAVEVSRNSTVKAVGKCIGVNLRMAKYSEVDEKYSEQIRNAVISAKNIYKTTLIPLPISTDEPDSDILSLSKLFKGNLDVKLLNVNSAEQLSNSVSKCRVVITGSYHAGVFALSQGLQVVGLAKSQYYHNKFEGLADQFKNGCRIVDLSSPSLENELKQAIAEAWEDTPIYRQSLLDSADYQIKLSKQAYHALALWNE